MKLRLLKIHTMPAPLLNPLWKQLANRLRPQAVKSLVIRHAGEEANEKIHS